MARIRTIKPEFWSSTQIAECSPNVRLMFIGLWTFCDDNGIHPYDPMRIKMQIFPADNFTKDQILDFLKELESANLIESYTVKEKKYFIIRSWKKHQRIDQPTYSHPLPNGEVPAQPWRRREKNNSDSVRRTDDERSENVRIGNGKDRIGVIVSCSNEHSDFSLENSPNLQLDLEDQKQNKKKSIEGFEELWKKYPALKKGSKQKALESFLRIVNEYPLDVLCSAVDRQSEERKTMLNEGLWVPEWKHLTTWLNQKCFLDEVRTKEEIQRAARNNKNNGKKSNIVGPTKLDEMFRDIRNRNIEI